MFHQPGVGKILYVAKMIVYIEDATNKFECGKYGDLAALTNGVKIRTTTGGTDTVVLDLGHSSVKPVTCNGCWKQKCFETTDCVAGAVVATAWRCNFDEAGAGLWLDGDATDRLEIVLADDLTGLLGHTFMVEGVIL